MSFEFTWSFHWYLLRLLGPELKSFIIVSSCLGLKEQLQKNTYPCRDCDMFKDLMEYFSHKMFLRFLVNKFILPF